MPFSADEVRIHHFIKVFSSHDLSSAISICINCITRAAAKPAFITQLHQLTPPLQPRLIVPGVKAPRHYPALSLSASTTSLISLVAIRMTRTWHSRPVMASCVAAEAAQRILNKQENSYASCGLTELNYKCIKGGLDGFFMTDIYFPLFSPFFLL